MARRIVSTPRMDVVRKRIEEMIREQSLWGQRLLGYRRLAAELGVCKQTLQRALAGMEADGLIERRHGSGTYVLDEAQRRTRAAAASLAIVTRSTPDLDDGWSASAEMIAGVEFQAARVRTSCQSYAWKDPADAELLADARAMRAHSGFILIRFADPLVVSSLLALNAGPVVVVDEPVHGQPVVWVTEDSFNGAREVTRHLLALGHRRIAFLDVGDREQWNPSKHDGYRAALEKAGLPVDPRLTVAPALGVPVISAQAPGLIDAAVTELLALPQPPTAIFAYDDRRAILVAESLRRRGLVPGRDVSVAGFGDTASRLGTCDFLTSCHIDFRKLGREAVRAAFSRGVPGEGRSLMLPDRLVVRSSTAAPATRIASRRRKPS
jgi:LacI family transcriptional regulator, galactose operon repressor